jgi:DNA-nicking Smr family endonuclease
MDFGAILDEWDKIKREHEDSPSSAERDLDGLDRTDRQAESRRLAGLKPQAVLDLHGMTAEEAESAITRFVDASARSGLEKVLVIHGKGLHSEGGVPVLKQTARRTLEADPLAGRFGEAAKADGGSGALWVMIRDRRSGS